MSSMILRKAVEEDWTAISAISRRTGYNDYINRIGSSYLTEGTVTVAVEDSVIGFSKVERLEDGSTWLSGLRVDPDHRREGVGKLITKRAVELSRELGAYAARMLIEESNKKSRSLSESLGFTVAGEYDFFSGSPVIDGYRKYKNTERIYVACGWKFLETRKSVDAPGSFYSGKGSKVFANGERKVYHLLSRMEPLEAAEEGITVCSVQECGGKLEGFRPLEDFPRGLLYELLL